MTSRNLEHIVDLYMGASVTLQWPVPISGAATVEAAQSLPNFTL